MHRMVAGGPALKPMHGEAVMAGPALTVKTTSGDNLMIHKAIDIAEPGDIIVVDGNGDLTNYSFTKQVLWPPDDLCDKLVPQNPREILITRRQMKICTANTSPPHPQ